MWSEVSTKGGIARCGISLFAGLMAFGCDQPNVGARGGGTASDRGSENGGSTAGEVEAPPPMIPPQDLPQPEPGVPMGTECAAEEHEGKFIPLDLLFLVDVSGSMAEIADKQTKWVAVREALKNFLGDPSSAGLGAGLRFFPTPAKACTAAADCSGEACEADGVCTDDPAMVSMPDLQGCDPDNVGFGCFLGGSSCTRYGNCSLTGQRCAPVGMPCGATGVSGDMCLDRPKLCDYSTQTICAEAQYETPTVAMAELPGIKGAISDALDSIVPNHGTPMGPGVRGSMVQLQALAAANANRKPILVLATDGLPQSCGFTNRIPAVVEALTEARMSPAKILTYVIGVFNPDEVDDARESLQELADGGGTMTPFILEAGADLGAAFLQALNQIRGQALGCEFEIPMPQGETLDYGKVNVSVKVAGTATDLVYVTSADKCDPAKGGWHYDVDPASGGTPTRVLLCPGTCEQVKGEMGEGVKLRFGCKTMVD